MLIDGRCKSCLAVLAMVLGFPHAGTSFAGEPLIAKGGRPEALIVVGREASEFTRWVAGELRLHLKELTGAEILVVPSDEAPKEKPLIVVGGPESNPLSAAAQGKELVAFAGLKPDGFLLKRITLEGVPALLIGGNDETSTMYAAYELLERLGVVFQLTGDIIPERKPDLAMPALDVRMEPVLKYRGMDCCHGLRWYMGLKDFRKYIDRMAKLKLNCLQFVWGIGGSPWLRFSYGGKVAEIYYPKESGYVAWGGPEAFSTSGTADDVRVGRECFPNRYLGPPEFAAVETPEQAFVVARDFLREIIHYAHLRKVQVWLMLAEIPRVPPSLAPPVTAIPRGWSVEGLFYCGRSLPHGHPAVLDIWESAVCAMIETYPEADRYGVWTSEDRPAYDDPSTRRLMDEYADARKLILPPEEIRRQGNDHVRNALDLESDFAELCVTAKLIGRIRTRHPGAKLGVATLFRGYLLRALDSMLPKDVWLMNMENYGNTASVMHFYSGIADRELLAMPRIDQDGCELHMQLNASLYDRDEIIPGAARYGLAGVIGQLNKERGLECNARFISDGAWDRHISCRSFYTRYLSRVFGPVARETLLKAYLLMEDNGRIAGWWRGHNHVFIGFNRFSPVRFPLRTSALQGVQPKPRTQDLQEEIKAAVQEKQLWTDLAARYRQASRLLRQARPQVSCGAQEELDYVIFKTENFAGYLDVLAASYEAVESCDQAVLAQDCGDKAELQKQLEISRAAMSRADCLAREVARQMIPFASIPTEKYQLFRFNQNVIGWIETSRTALAESVALAGQPALDSSLQDLWDMAAIRKAPLDVEVVSSSVKDGYKAEGLYITSEMTPSGPNRVYLDFARPEKCEKPVPLFINLTAGADNLDFPLWLARQLKCAVVDIEWRNPKSEHRSKWAHPTDLNVWHIGSEATDNIGYALVTATRRAIDYLALQPEIDSSRIACGGGSMGGYYSLLLAGVDDRVKCVFDTYGAGNLAKSGGRIGTGLSTLTSDQRRSWFSAFDPIGYASHTKASAFVYLAANDFFFWLGDGLANYDALAGEKRMLIVPNFNHNFGAFGEPVSECGWDWVKHCLHGEPAFPTVTDPKARGCVYTWRASGPLPIAKSVLYWSPGNVNWPSRYWLPISAARSGDTWKAAIPKEFAVLAARVYVTVFDNADRAASSRVVLRRGEDPWHNDGPLWPGNSLWDTGRGPAAWRPTGPAAAAGPAPESVETAGSAGLRILPARDGKRFALMTNSTILAAGPAPRYRGIRLVVDGCGSRGSLIASLQRNSGSTAELAYSTTVKYGASRTVIDIPWCVFKGPSTASADPYPFDGLRLDGERPDGSALVIESIELYGQRRR